MRRCPAVSTPAVRVRLRHSSADSDTSRPQCSSRFKIIRPAAQQYSHLYQLDDGPSPPPDPDDQLPPAAASPRTAAAATTRNTPTDGLLTFKIHVCGY